MNNVYAKSLKEVLKEAEVNKTSATFFATGRTEQCYIISQFSGIKLLFVNASYEAIVLKENLNAFNEPCLIFPEVTRVFTETYVSDDAQIIKVLNQIEEVKQAGKNLTVILTPNSLCALLPSYSLIQNNFLQIQKNKEYNLKALQTTLINLGYTKVDIVSDVKEFSLKGDLLTIYEATQSSIFRVSFFGDLVEYIAKLNKNNFAEIEKFDELKISGNKINLNINLNELDEIKKAHKLHTLKGESLENYNKLFSQLELCVENQNIPLFLLPLINKSEKLCNYFNAYNLTTFIIEPKRFSESLVEVVKSNLNSYNALLASGLVTNMHKYNFVTDILSFFKNKNFNYISLQSLLSSNPYFKTDNFLSLDVNHQTLSIGLTMPIKNQIRECLEHNFDITIICQNEFTKNVVSKEIDELYKETNIKFFVGSISSSIIIPTEKIAIFGIKSVGSITNESQRKKIFNAESFKEGDFVVHSFHGIGKFIGIVKRTVFGYEKDFIELAYQNGAKLFVPCENANMLAKYSGATPRLSVMGGKDFEKEKNKVRASVKELAFNLAKLYADRRERKGFKFVEDDELQLEFEKRFSYEETPAQLATINEVKKDMQSAKIMDRLICGDVGFGKTEVALRAAFKAVLSGKQVCLLAPTTILALQHYKTFKARMDAYQINIALLCRFVKGAHVKQNLFDIENGKIQVIIGTHRVLSEDVKFFDLGLFIVDEEQRFGTGQKEKIKNIKHNVDSLALSATPIPRTLHLSLINVRDISVIDTPPKNRIPVQVYVCSYSLNLVLTAIDQEIARGGQVLIIYNNTEKVEEYASMLRNKLNGITVDFGHAKLSSKVLEEKVLKVFNNETQVFVSTTIIENGVDLKNANTLLVIDANRFGLSQLYQLKGRVGRNQSQAYAYFFTNAEKTISEDADKRLNAIMEFSNLGSGIEIAKKDLEIRGAGNIFGAEQSGHMDRIGYEEYVKILDEEVKKATGEATATSIETIVETDINMFVDYTYAKSTEERTKIYKDLSLIFTEEELFEYLATLKNKYGDMPQSVKNIGEICLIKNLANKNLRAEKLILKQDKCAIIIDKENFNFTNEFYKKLSNCGFVLVFDDKGIIKDSKAKVKIELKQNLPTNEKISKLKQIVS